MARRVARAAAILCEDVRREMVGQSLTKEDRSPVTVADFGAQAIVCRDLARELPNVPRVWLMGSAPDGGLTPARLAGIATFATGIGPSRNLVAEDPGLVARAHAAGLTVTAYTFASRSGDAPTVVRDEMSHFLYTLGGDALFTNNPDRFPRQSGARF